MVFGGGKILKIINIIFDAFWISIGTFETKNEKKVHSPVKLVQATEF